MKTNKKIAKITIINSEYNENIKKYNTEIKISYLISFEVAKNQQEFENEENIFTNIELSQTSFNNVVNKKYYIIDTSKIKDNVKLISFAKLHIQENEPNSNDRFLNEIIKKEMFWISQERLEISGEESLEDIIESQHKGDTEIAKDIIDFFKCGCYEYLVFDVNGFLSYIKNCYGEHFYIDCGDLNKSYVPVDNEPKIALISHAHNDHYSLITSGILNPQNIIMPYNGSVFYKGNHYYNNDEIAIINRFKNNSIIIVKKSLRSLKPRERQKNQKFKLSDVLTIHLPIYMSPKNLNLESIICEVNLCHNKVLYPGDSMFYVYKKLINSSTNLVTAHHGGETGAIKFPNQIQSITTNTLALNYRSAVYCKNYHIYKTSTSKFTVGNLYSGNCFVRFI